MKIYYIQILLLTKKEANNPESCNIYERLILLSYFSNKAFHSFYYLLMLPKIYTHTPYDIFSHSPWIFQPSQDGEKRETSSKVRLHFPRDTFPPRRHQHMRSEVIIFHKIFFVSLPKPPPVRLCLHHTKPQSKTTFTHSQYFSTNTQIHVITQLVLQIDFFYALHAFLLSTNSRIAEHSRMCSGRGCMAA